MEDCFGDVAGSGEGARGVTEGSTEEERCRWRVLERRGHYNVGTWGKCQKGESSDLKEGAWGALEIHGEEIWTAGGCGGKPGSRGVMGQGAGRP